MAKRQRGEGSSREFPLFLFIGGSRCHSLVGVVAGRARAWVQRRYHQSVTRSTLLRNRERPPGRPSSRQRNYKKTNKRSKVQLLPFQQNRIRQNQLHHTQIIFQPYHTPLRERTHQYNNNRYKL